MATTPSTEPTAHQDPASQNATKQDLAGQNSAGAQDRTQPDGAGAPSGRRGWAVLGPGSIARRFLSQLPHASAPLVAVGSSSSQRSGRLFDPDTAGGGILDVGGYPVTMAMAIVGAATGTTSPEPDELSAKGTVGPTGVDEWSQAFATYPGGITASLRTGVRVQDQNSVTVHGTTGRIRLADPWTLGPDPTIDIATIGGAQSRSFAGAFPYALEAEATLAALIGGGVEVPQMTHADTLATARVLDRWRADLSLRFGFEAEDAEIGTVSGRPLSVAADHPTARCAAGQTGAPSSPC